MNLQGVSLVRGIVSVKPVTDRDVGKIIQSQQRVAISFKNFNPDIPILFSDDPHRENIEPVFHFHSPFYR
jgi:hypothetical protein